LTWPHWPRARHWLHVSKEILEREVRLQNAADGVNLEQAVAYQHFVLDLLILPLLAGRASRQWFSVAYESRIEAMLEYLASIMDSDGNVPMFGDSDDAVVVNFAQASALSPYRSLLGMGAILFQRDDFRAKAGALDDKARWLLGGDADALFEKQSGARARLLPARQAFCKGGYYILGCDFETEGEIRLIVDAGPLGYRSIAAHGHADALALTLSLGGKEFLIDPGTYAYHTQRPWRAYFRGTSAHNTVAVDGRDQSESGGAFMWLQKARAGCNVWSTTAQQDLFEGWHDGYMRLPSPVMHRRRIVLDKLTRQILIEDTLHMTGEHDIALFFHFSERCQVDSVANGYRIKQGSKALVLKLPQRCSATSHVYVGSSSPICGWVSRRFDHKQPAPTVAWKARLAGEVVLRTEIAC